MLVLIPNTTHVAIEDESLDIPDKMIQKQPSDTTNEGWHVL